MKNDHVLTTNQIKAGYNKRVIIDDISLIIPQNKISVIIGANACGKSTLLKTIARLIKPLQGEILFDGKRIQEIPPKQLAKTLGLLPQSPIVPEGIAVYDLVSRGRFPYQSFAKGLTAQDHKAVQEALSIMGISDLSDRNVDELSGGQRQRVWIAMSLAQETDILLLDEPTTFLDITHQIEILDLLSDLNQKRGTTIVMVLHDINLSARYADYIFAVSDGKLISQGEPSEIISASLIKEIFDLDCSVIMDPVSLTPMIIPIGKYHVRA